MARSGGVSVTQPVTVRSLESAARPETWVPHLEHGCEAFSDRKRRPVRYANQLPQQVECLIVTLKREKPHWGARKILELLLRRLASDVRVPCRAQKCSLLFMKRAYKCGAIRRVPVLR